jgi:hypothetical protein
MAPRADDPYHSALSPLVSMDTLSTRAPMNLTLRAATAGLNLLGRVSPFDGSTRCRIGGPDLGTLVSPAFGDAP